MANNDPDYSFAVLRVFTHPPGQQQRVVDAMRVFATAQLHLQPGACSFELFSDESQQHIISLARWKDRESFEAFQHSEDAVRASELARGLAPAVYFLRPEAAVALNEHEVSRATG